MKYAILIADTEAGRAVGGADLEQWMGEIGAWYEKSAASGRLADAGEQLDRPDSARTIRSTAVTDGPYIESKEVLGAFSVLEADSIDAAVELARTWPGVDRGWVTIEVRPVIPTPPR
jgi:hypothetical protein